MKYASFIALLAAVVNASQDLQFENYTFEKFLQEFGLKYHPSELAARRTIFENELQRIRAHNAQRAASWKEGVNKFSALTASEKRALFGRNKRSAKQADKLLKHAQPLPADFKLQPVSALPKHVDWREEGIVNVVKDQGHCGSCWSFAATSVIESHVAKATGLLFDLSVQQVAMCTPNPQHCGGTGGCHGSTSELAFDYVSGSAGLFSEYQYGYTSYYGVESACVTPSTSLAKPAAKINGFVQLPENNYTALMNAIATVGPVAISVDASSWHGYSSGIFDGCNQKNPDINHAVVLVGYGEENGEKYWIVRNSWSPSWGEKGHIRVKRVEDEEKRCGSDVTPEHGSACEGDSDPVEVCGTCGILYDSSYPLNAARA